MVNRKVTIGAAVCMFLMLACAAPPVAVAGQTEWTTILLAPGGQLNGQTVDASHRWIEKQPNDPIDGTVYIDVYSTHADSSVVPVGATLAWGSRGDVWGVSSDVTPGVWHRLSVTIPSNRYVPATPGFYYVVLGSEGEFDAFDIMSATNWPYGSHVWNDGNDLGWDWTDDQFAAAAANGYVTNKRLNLGGSYTDVIYGANWVGVHVVPEPASLALLLISGAALLRRR